MDYKEKLRRANKKRKEGDIKITDKDLLRAKESLKDEIDNEVESLQEKLSKIVDNPDKGSAVYRRRLDKICKVIEEKFLSNRLNVETLTFCADFYQRIEVFMNYTKRKDTETGVTIIETDIHDLISEMYKSMYINFLLSYLEGEFNFKLPYFGKLYLKRVQRFSPFLQKMTEIVLGRITLDKELRKDLVDIDKKKKINMVSDILLETKKILAAKLYADLVK
jgi:hypothetical protein